MLGNREEDTEVNQEAILEHLRSCVTFCGRFVFRLESAYQTRPAKKKPTTPLDRPRHTADDTRSIRTYCVSVRVCGGGDSAPVLR